MQIETYVLPRNWAHYLIYGERDGYDEGECSRIDFWARRAFRGAEFYDCVDVADDCHFTAWHDARHTIGGAAECLTFMFHVDRS